MSERFRDLVGSSRKVVLVGVVVAWATIGCSCRDESAAARSAAARSAKTDASKLPEAGAAGPRLPAGDVPKPPVHEGRCDCAAEQYCAQAMEPVKGGYPKYVHRCIDVPDGCQRCDCLAVDPCWEPMACRSLRAERKDVLCEFPKIRKVN